MSLALPDHVDVEFHDFGHTSDDLRAAVLRGLDCEPKTLPSKFFYDERGSRLFDQICELAEYYPTRTELALLEKSGEEIAACVGEDATIIEFGIGSAMKTRRLLDAVTPRTFVPIDISREHLLAAASELVAGYPATRFIALCADFTREIALPASVGGEHRVGFFPGSTIGNFTHRGAVAFMATVRDLVGPGGGLLVGVDLRKDAGTLEAAYNDSKGVTAAFNSNLLVRINSELGADFDPGAFRHHAPWCPEPGRIEMHLVSTREQTVTVGGATFSFRAGESIHTEDSHKYEVREFQALARAAGFEPERHWVDAARLFSLHFLRV